jgi:hypothetical protein
MLSAVTHAMKRRETVCTNFPLLAEAYRMQKRVFAKSLTPELTGAGGGARQPAARFAAP